MTRRDFISTAGAASVAFSAAPLLASTLKPRPYRTALIGSGWWGMNILHCAIESGACRVVALCDVDANQLDPALADVEKRTGEMPKRYTDYREMLDREKPDIAIVATPDHWHPLATIAAVKAG